MRFRIRLSAVTVFVVAAFVVAGAQAPMLGNAIVDVTVVDRFGAPLEGVTVKLRGVVDREASTNDVGMVAFDELPAGRYDVVASMNGLAPSTPRVVDMPAFGVRAVALALKPFGSLSGMDACGGFDPSSVTTLSKTAHLVLHGRVVDQHAVEMQPRIIATVNRVEVLQSFKGSTHTGGTLTIRQGGGRIDRGDYIDHMSFNQLLPLNVGDEYVLFIHVDSAGSHTIVGSEEGAFRVRNGRVEPQGDAGAANTWQGQPASAFFQALRALR